MLYLDNAATTPIHSEVLDTMIEYMRNEYGNPASKYYTQAIDAQEALKRARNEVADLLGCEPEYIVFTSGAAESNSFIIKGVAEKFKRRGKHIITSKIEHKSVLETCKVLEKQGYSITYIDNDEFGQVNVSDLEKAITDETILVSIMWGNNEIGSINNVEEIAKICQEEEILFHTDATQVVGKINIELKKIPIDFLSMSAHKIYGPKGIGVAYIGPDDLNIRYKLPALINGGSQEFGMRGGTHSMHNIVGLGKACEVTKRDMKKNVEKISELETEFKKKILEIRSDITFNGNQENKIPGLLSINIPEINNEIFCKRVSNEMAISTGSACSIDEGSHVLKNINVGSRNTLRVSISKDIYVDEVIEVFKKNII